MAEGMRRAPLTQALVSKLTLADHAPAGATDHIVWDDEMPSFGVRLRSTKASYVVQYRVRGSQRRETLGDTRKVTLKDARRAASQRFAQVALGTDPSAERRKAAEVTPRFGTVVDRYLAAKKPTLRPNSWNAAQRYFKDYWKPFDSLRLEEITQRRISALLGQLLAKRGRTAVARARGNLSALFTWAMREGLVGTNPVIATNDPIAGTTERDRVLSDHEIRAIWATCRDDDFGRIVKLLLLTACRRDEIGGLSWHEVDLETGMLEIPGSRTKAKRALRLPLSPMALDVLKTCPPKEGRDFLFGQWGGAFSRWAWEKLAIDKRMAEAGEQISPWRLHDLRRTAATRMAQYAPLHVVESVLNHSIGSKVMRTYNRYSYEAEKRDALCKWSDELSRILAGGKIVQILRTA